MKYRVKCLDAKYESDTGSLVLNCWFDTIGEQRIVILDKNDFHFKQPGNTVPDHEMKKTAALFRQKEFYLVISDEEKFSEKTYYDALNKINRDAGKVMDDVAKNLDDEKSQMQRRLAKLMEDNQLNAKKLLESELAIRAKIS